MEYLEILRQFFFRHQDGIIIFSYTIAALGFLQNIVYFIQIPLAAMELVPDKLKNQDEYIWWMMTVDVAMPISIIIPAYNEEVTIIDTIASALAMQYPVFEVIVVNDGSKDRTFEDLIRVFELSHLDHFYEKKLDHKEIRGLYKSKTYPNLIVVDKERGGRSDALNAGIDVSRHPLFCTIDADSLLDHFALLKTVRPFIEKPGKVVASGGTIRIINGCTVEDGMVKEINIPQKILPLLQTIEYIRAFLMCRVAWSRAGILTIISGAFAIFKRDITVEVGGFNIKTIGEDFDLVIKIHEHCLRNKREYEMEFISRSVCWTEVPESMKVLRGQRIRWQQGSLEVFFGHIKMFMNPRYGRIGMIAYPLMFIFDVVGPLAELSGYILVPIFYFLGILNLSFMLLFISMFFVMGIFISAMALILEEISLKRFNSAKDLFVLGIVAIIENFGFRQYNSIWRIVGWWRFLIRRQLWGDMTRVGIK